MRPRIHTMPDGKPEISDPAQVQVRGADIRMEQDGLHVRKRINIAAIPIILQLHKISLSVTIFRK